MFTSPEGQSNQNVIQTPTGVSSGLELNGPLGPAKLIDKPGAISDSSQGLPEQKELEPGKIKYDVIGDTFQALRIHLPEGKSIYTESGAWSSGPESLKMTTVIRNPIAKAIGGEPLLANKFTSKLGTSEFVITSRDESTGEIVEVELDGKDSEFHFQRGAYLSHEEGIDLDIHLIKKPRAAIWGGEGFFLEVGKGKGKIHLKADGEAYWKELKKGETLEVDEGDLIGYDSTINHEMRTVKGGPINWAFGGEGLLVNKLTGPGRILLSTRKRSLRKDITKMAKKEARKAALNR
jgi:uncharacterized protein (AIM24 family)